MHLHSHTGLDAAIRRRARARRTCAALAVALTSLLAGGHAHAQDSGDPASTTTTTATPEEQGPLDPAVRIAPPIQVTPTDPPPPTTTEPPDPCASLPANSGDGRRLVYSKSCQRVWAFEADGTMVKTHLVSGRMNQPRPGTYSVFSRSSYTCNIKNPSICWRYMVRFTVGPDGDNIGFHEIPNQNGRPVQSEAQLGQPLSGGCVRQATPDAVWVWNWAPVGTKVVVLA